jgi:hypothetical protein
MLSMLDKVVLEEFAARFGSVFASYFADSSVSDLGRV